MSSWCWRFWPPWATGPLHATNTDRPRPKLARSRPCSRLVHKVAWLTSAAGNGRFTIPLARHIAPDGYIYATELDLDRLQDLQRAVTRAELENVTILEADPAHTGLPPHCCDGVLLRTVYHHLTEPASIAADLFAAVRPRGRLVVIDFPPHGLLSLFARVDGVPDDRGGHGIPPEVVAKELTHAGFRLERQIDDWRGRNYCLVFTRPRV